MNENSDARDGAPEKTNPKLLQLFVSRCSLILRAEQEQDGKPSNGPWENMVALPSSFNKFSKKIHSNVAPNAPTERSFCWFQSF